MMEFFDIGFFITIFLIVTLVPMMWYLITLKKDTEVKIELTKYPFGLPKGTIRAILTLLVVAACLIIISNQGDATPEPIKSVLLAVVGFYFGQRTGDLKGSTNKTK